MSARLHEAPFPSPQSNLTWLHHGLYPEAQPVYPTRAATIGIEFHKHFDSAI
jgi:hypothetical protein